MNKLKFIKKLSVIILSLVSAIALSVTAIYGYYANASYDYSSSNKTKNEEYLEGLFTYQTDEATVTANYDMPSYYQQNEKYNNGVLIDFKKENTSVITTKTYTVEELKQFIKFSPIVSKENFGIKAEIEEFDIEIFEEKTSGSNTYVANSVTYKFSKSNLAFNVGTVLNVKALSNDGTSVSEQNFGSYVCLSTNAWINIKDATSTTPAIPNLLWKTPFLRKFIAGKRSFACVGQTFGGAPNKNPITLGYEQTSTSVIATAPSYDGGVNDLYTGDVEGMGVVRKLNEPATLPAVSGLTESDFTDDNLYFGLIDNVIFNGFSLDAQLKIKFTPKIGTGAILINELAGENLSTSLRINDKYKGYVGIDYNLPLPSYYENGIKQTENLPNYEYEILKSNGDVLQAKTAYTTSSKYCFTQTGDYKIVYYCVDDGNYYSTTLNLSVYAQESFNDDKVILNLNNNLSNLSNFERCKGNVISVGASSSSNVYLNNDVSTVFLTVFIDGLKEDEFEVNETSTYKLPKSGNYEFKFVAKDALSTTEQTLSVFISDCYYDLTLPDYTDWTYGDADTKPLIDKNVVIFSDGNYGRNFFNNTEANVNLVLKVKKPNETTYQNFTNDELENGYNFTSFGVYSFAYKLTYVSKLGSDVNVPTNGEFIEFSVNVTDSTLPTLILTGNSYLNGAHVESVEDKTIVYSAEKGNKISLGSFVAYDEVGNKFNLTDDIKVNLTYLKPDNTFIKSDETSLLDGSEYTLENVGLYVFNITVNDGFNEEYFIIKINVVDKIYSIVTKADLGNKYDTGIIIKSDVFKVLDVNGNEADDITKKYIIYRNGTKYGEYDTLNFEVTASGEYTVSLCVYKNNEIVTQKSYNFTASDKTAPEITITGKIKKSGVVGEVIPIATVIAVDNQDEAGDLTNSLVILDANGNEMNYYNGTFVSINSGVYTVIYSSTDVSGNKVEYSYEITITEDVVDNTVFGAPLWSVIICGVGLLVLIGAIVFMFIYNKKKPVEFNDEI